MLTVVTGASGHVGGNLVRALLDEGRQVRCVVREDTRALAGLDVECVRGDVREPESLRSAFAGAEVVFHLAAKISIQGGLKGLVESTNHQGARNVAEVALASRVRRLIHCSSIHAFDQRSHEQLISEVTPRSVGRQFAAYDQSKAAGEQAVRGVVAKGLDAVIIHPAGVIGPYDFKPSRMGNVLVRLFERKIPALVPGGYNWVDARDVAKALIQAEKRGRTNESYLVAGHWVTMRAFGALTAAITGVPAPRWIVPLGLAKFGAPFAGAWNRLFGGEPLFTLESLRALSGNSRVDGAKAARELGHVPRPLFETLRDTYAWFAATNRIRGANALERSGLDRSQC